MCSESRGGVQSARFMWQTASRGRNLQENSPERPASHQISAAPVRNSSLAERPKRPKNFAVDMVSVVLTGIVCLPGLDSCSFTAEGGISEDLAPRKVESGYPLSHSRSLASFRLSLPFTSSCSRGCEVSLAETEPRDSREWEQFTLLQKDDSPKETPK